MWRAGYTNTDALLLSFVPLNKLLSLWEGEGSRELHFTFLPGWIFRNDQFFS